MVFVLFLFLFAKDRFFFSSLVLTRGTPGLIPDTVLPRNFVKKVRGPRDLSYHLLSACDSIDHTNYLFNCIYLQSYFFPLLFLRNTLKLFILNFFFTSSYFFRFFGIFLPFLTDEESASDLTEEKRKATTLVGVVIFFLIYF